MKGQRAGNQQALPAAGQQAPAPAFGAMSAPSLFGGGTPAFGAASSPFTATPAFGSAPAFGGGAFGASSAAFGSTLPAFGSTTSSPFGASSAFGAGAGELLLRCSYSLSCWPRARVSCLIAIAFFAQEGLETTCHLAPRLLPHFRKHHHRSLEQLLHLRLVRQPLEGSGRALLQQRSGRLSQHPAPRQQRLVPRALGPRSASLPPQEPPSAQTRCRLSHSAVLQPREPLVLRSLGSPRQHLGLAETQPQPLAAAVSILACVFGVAITDASLGSFSPVRRPHLGLFGANKPAFGSSTPAFGAAATPFAASSPSLFGSPAQQPGGGATGFSNLFGGSAASEHCCLQLPACGAKPALWDCAACASARCAIQCS